MSTLWMRTTTEKINHSTRTSLRTDFLKKAILDHKIASVNISLYFFQIPSENPIKQDKSSTYVHSAL